MRHKNTIFAKRMNHFSVMKVYFSGKTNFLLGNIKKNVLLILSILYNFSEKKNKPNICVQLACGRNNAIKPWNYGKNCCLCKKDMTDF